MPESTQLGNYLDFSSNGQNIPLLTKNYSKEPFDSSYWEARKVSIVSIPWVPFFSNCKGYGRHMYFFDLLELHSECDLKKVSETLVVQSVPTTGFNPIADNCNVNIECTFEASSDLKWWKAQDSKVLYYITQEPLSIQDYVKYKVSTSHYETILTQNGDQLIPVEFSSKGFIDNAYPSTVQFTLLYYQITTTKKKLVKVTVELKDYVKNTNENHPVYKLNVVYKAMGYIELMNAFQFDLPIYFFLFLIFNLIMISGMTIFYFFNKFISRVENPPLLRIKRTFKIVCIPQIVGTFLASVPVVCLVLFVYVTYNGGTFDSIFYQYDVVSPNGDSVIQTKRGRLGFMYFVLSIIILHYGIEMIISKPSEEDEKNVIQTLKKKQQEYEKINNDESFESNWEEDSEENYNDEEDSDSDSENEDFGTNLSATLKMKNRMIQKSLQEKIKKEKERKKQIEEEKLQEYEIGSILERKKYHFILIVIFCGLFFIVFLEISFSKAFVQYLWVFIIFFMLIESILLYILQHKVLHELLLIAPIIVAAELIQYVTVMAADNFQNFVLSYLMRLSMLILYFDPIFKNVNYFMNLLYKWARGRVPFLERILKNDQQLSYYMSETDTTKVDQNNLEPIITILLVYTSKAHSNYIRCIILLIISICPVENKIPQLYGFKIKDLYYYLLFVFEIIIAQTISDIYVLNCLELIHGHKLFDYFSYCSYRYKIRVISWLPHNFNLDKSLSIPHRSLDNLVFSNQFYFMTTLITYGICLITLSVSIMIRNDYVPFGDPALFPIISFIAFIVSIGKLILSFVLNHFFNFWKVSDKKDKKILESIECFYNTTGGLNFENMMEADLIRKHFIQFNKEWIIKNLKYILKPEHFEENDGYLLNLYQMLYNEEKKDIKEKKREEMLKKKQMNQLATKKNTGDHPPEIQDFLDGNQINSNFEDLTIYDHNNPQNNVIKIKKSTAENIRKILDIWLYGAKETLYLQSLIKDVQEKKMEEMCRKCGIDVELNLVENVPLVELMKDFRVRIAGRPFNKEEWKRFYEKNQKFVTLCIECNLQNKLKKQKLINSFKRTVLKNTDNKKKENEEKEVYKIILYKWLFLARSTIRFNLEKKF